MLDYRCMVSGSEQKFLLGLGVSAKNSLGVLLIHFNATILPCSFIPSFPVLKGLKESPSAVPETARYLCFFLLMSLLFTLINPVSVISAHTETCTPASVSNYLHCPFKGVVFLVLCVGVKSHWQIRIGVFVALL